jgi:hypothetical protein
VKVLETVVTEIERGLLARGFDLPPVRKRLAPS